MLLCFAFFGLARAEIVEIGVEGGTSTNTYLPTYEYYKYSLTQQIYTADEIGTAGTINSIAFFFTGTSTRTLDVYMVNTTMNSFSGNSDWITVTAADLVYSGSLTYTANAWNTLDLDTPFVYDGTSNLAVIVDDNTGSYVSSVGSYVFNATSMALRVYSDGTNYDPMAPPIGSGAVLSVKNQIQLDITTGGGFYCSRPTNLDVALTPGNGTVATLNWTENGSASAWQICLNDDETNLIDVYENTYMLTGLTAETPYTAKVRANCGNSLSTWSNTVSFTPTNAYQITVNDGGTINEYVPVYGYWCDQYSKSQFIIPAGSLQDLIGGVITKMTFYANNNAVSWGSAQFEVYMTEVDSTTFSSPELVDWNTMDKVKDASILSISNGQMVVEFDYN